MKNVHFLFLNLIFFLCCFSVNANNHIDKNKSYSNESCEDLIVALNISDHCEGDNPIAAPFIGGGTFPYTYAWAHGPTTSSVIIDELSNGNSNATYTYTVTVTDAIGCSAIASDIFRVFSLPQITVEVSEPDCVTGIAEVCFSFPDNPHRRLIEISIDGVYQDSVPDNSESVCYDFLPGTYDLGARWGNDDCPISLGEVTIAETSSGCTSNSEGLPDSVVFNETQCMIFVHTSTTEVFTNTNCLPTSFTYIVSYSDGTSVDITNNTTLTQNGNTLTFAATGLDIALPPCSDTGGPMGELFSITLTFPDGTSCNVQGGRLLCYDIDNLSCNECEEACEDCCDIEGEATVKGQSCTSVKVCVSSFENCPEVDYNIYYVVLGGQPLSGSNTEQNKNSSEPCKTFTGLDPCRSYQFFAQVIMPGCAPINVPIQCENCNEEGVFTFRETCCVQNL